MQEEAVYVIMPKKNSGEHLRKSPKTEERIFSYQRLVITDESDEMRKAIDEAVLDVVCIFVVAETAEDECACLPLSGVAAAQNS